MKACQVESESVSFSAPTSLLTYCVVSLAKTGLLRIHANDLFNNTKVFSMCKWLRFEEAVTRH